MMKAPVRGFAAMFGSVQYRWIELHDDVVEWYRLVDCGLKKEKCGEMLLNEYSQSTLICRNQVRITGNCKDERCELVVYGQADQVEELFDAVVYSRHVRHQALATSRHEGVVHGIRYRQESYGIEDAGRITSPRQQKTVSWADLIDDCNPLSGEITQERRGLRPALRQLSKAEKERLSLLEEPNQPSKMCIGEEDEEEVPRIILVPNPEQCSMPLGAHREWNGRNRKHDTAVQWSISRGLRSWRPPSIRCK